MTRVVRIFDGPHQYGGMVWLNCELSDGQGNVWEESVYYDSVGEANGEYIELLDGVIELEEDYIEEDYIEEDEIDE